MKQAQTLVLRGNIEADASSVCNCPIGLRNTNFQEEIAERKSKLKACRKDPGWLVGMCEAPERWKEESKESSFIRFDMV